MSGTVVVIGAGLAGLTAACHLAGRGTEVIVLERDDVPGGRAGRMERSGYRFDTGPSVLTMPGLLADTFAAAGTDMSSLLQLNPVDPAYRACFADGSELRVHADRDTMSAEIRQLCGPREEAAYHRFRDWLNRLYELEMPHFIARDFDSPLDLVHPVGPLLQLLKMGGFRRLGPTVARFFDDERLRRVFSFQAMYAGVAPRRALAIYATITHMDSMAGVWFPVGGMHAIPTALARAATLAGADIRYHSPAAEIVRNTSSGAVQGVRLQSGDWIAAEAVVCTAEIAAAYRTLLPGLTPPGPVRRARYSPSCVLWHAGVAGPLPAGVAHHNIHFGADWDNSFDAVIDRGELMPDPSTLVTVPTLGDPSLAPDHRSVLYALEPVPNLQRGRLDWAREREAVRDRLIARVASFGYPVDAEVESFLDPQDWAEQGMEAGTPFALAHTFAQTGPFRPSTTDRRAPGLLFAGSSTRPGVGVPMVLLSGRLAADRAMKLLRAANQGGRRDDRP